jgi:GAF domain-containing protein
MHGGPAQPAGIVAAPTYVVLAQTKSVIVQDDCRTSGPRPPESLTCHFRVYAQMLAPVLHGNEVIGTVSVHQQDTPRHWSADDVAALKRAAVEAAALLGRCPPQ